jgi:hypothetical protein
MVSYVLTHSMCLFFRLEQFVGKRQRYRSEGPFATFTLTLMAGFLNNAG